MRRFSSNSELAAAVHRFSRRKPLTPLVRGATEYFRYRADEIARGEPAPADELERALRFAAALISRMEAQLRMEGARHGGRVDAVTATKLVLYQRRTKGDVHSADVISAYPHLGFAEVRLVLKACADTFPAVYKMEPPDTLFIRGHIPDGFMQTPLRGIAPIKVGCPEEQDLSEAIEAADEQHDEISPLTAYLRSARASRSDTPTT